VVLEVQAVQAVQAVLVTFSEASVAALLPVGMQQEGQQEVLPVEQQVVQVASVIF
jgi:hypothetical protein